jgi:hypothetical protein
MATLAQILAGSQTVLDGVTGITTVYRSLPENAPADARLPAAVQQPLSGDVGYAASLRIVTHRWRVDVLVDRAGDIQTETGAAIALIEPVLAAFEANTTLGIAGCYDARPEGYEVVLVNHWQQAYLSLRFTMAAKSKTGVAMA